MGESLISESKDELEENMFGKVYLNDGSIFIGKRVKCN